MTSAVSAAQRAGDPAEAAQRLLAETWDLGTDETPRPIDPVYIAQQLGIKVYRSELEDGIAGLLVKRAGRDPEIHLNARDSKNRQRFTCAHEVGHYIKHATSDDSGWESIDRRDAMSTRGTDPDEIYANSFAANLLMPTGDVRRLSKRMPPEVLAVEFEVSLEAMKNRLDVLRLA